MYKGKLVTVRLYGGGTAQRRVLGVKGDIVVICSEEEYRIAQQEGREPQGLGFPRIDVFDNQTRTASA